jgi:CheY-like chemotaxis protein
MTKKPEEVRILVVDDEALVCNSCSKTLSHEGYYVDCALNGEEAQIKIASSRYDLVITDLKMPKVDGMELLRTVKKRWPEISVVMITGYGTIRSAVEAIKLGAFDYIPKPFTSEELAGVASRALGFTKMLREESPVLISPSAFGDIRLEDLDKMWCIPEHAWARIRPDGMGEVGLDAMYRRLIGGLITNLEIAPLHKSIRQGEACARITVKQSSDSSVPKEACHNVWCPIGGVVKEIHQEACEDLALLEKSPYCRGWLLRIEPSNFEEDVKNLKRFAESIGGRIAKKQIEKG